MLPLITFGQISGWRSGSNMGGSSRYYSTPRYNTPPPPVTNQRTDNSISRWRSAPPAPQNPRVYSAPTYRSYRYFSPYPYLGLYGYYYTSPYYWYDPYGYRVRGYIHHYEDGRMDTVKGQQPIKANLGIQFSGKNLLGGYVTIGNNAYFIAEYMDTKRTPNTTYFPYGRLSQVDFPLVSDEKLMRIVYLGGGKMIGRNTGYHVEVGFGSENINYRGQDALGYITFPKTSNNFTTVKFGLLHNYRNVGIKVDYDPIKEIFTWGVGLHL